MTFSKMIVHIIIVQYCHTPESGVSLLFLSNKGVHSKG